MGTSIQEQPTNTDARLSKSFNDALAYGGTSNDSISNIGVLAGAGIQRAIQEKQKKTREAALDAALDVFQGRIDNLQNQIDAAQERIDARNIQISGLEELINDIENGASAEDIRNDPRHQETLEKLRKYNGLSVEEFQLLDTARLSEMSHGNLADFETQNIIDEEGILNLTAARDQLAERGAYASVEEIAEIYSNNELSELGQFEISSNLLSADARHNAYSAAGADAADITDAISSFNVADSEFAGASVAQEISEGFVNNDALTPQFMQASQGGLEAELQVDQPESAPAFMLSSDL